MVDGPREELGEFSVVENIQVAAGWHLANCSFLPVAVSAVAIGTLNEDSLTVTKTLGKYICTGVTKLDSLSNVHACSFGDRVAIINT